MENTNNEYKENVQKLEDALKEIKENEAEIEEILKDMRESLGEDNQEEQNDIESEILIEESENDEDFDFEVEEYDEIPENAQLDRKGFSTKRLVAVGLACLCVGGIILAISKGCEKQKVSEENNDSVVTEQKLEKQYITKEEYTTGVKQLCDSLNKDYGFNYQPSQLTSFYYLANMENISNDLFMELVNEGFIPDTVSKLLANVFEITGSIRTTNLQKGGSNFDYNKLFVNSEIAVLAEQWEVKYNSLNGATPEEKAAVLKELEDFIIVNPNSGYNNLPTGSKEIFNWTIAESIYTKAESYGNEASEALKAEIADMTTAIVLFNNSFACITVDENQKQLTK